MVILTKTLSGEVN